MRTALRHALLATALLACSAGCAGDGDELVPGSPSDPPDSGDQRRNAASGDPCGAPVSVRPVAADELVGGTTPTGLATAMQGTYDASLRWWGTPPSGSAMLSAHATQAHIEVRADSTMARVVERAECSAILEVAATLTLRTDDGTFNEVFPAALSGSHSAALIVASNILPDALVGTYDASFFEPVAPRIHFVVRLNKEREGDAAAVEGYAFMCGSERGSLCASIVDI